MEEMREREMMEKSENKTLKRFLRVENIKKISRLNEYSKEKYSRDLEGKFQRSQDFMNLKNQMAVKRKDASDELARKKEEYTKKFENIFGKGQMNV